jgi:hypothetical protein
MGLPPGKMRGVLEKKKPPGPEAREAGRAPEGARRYVRRRVLKVSAVVGRLDICLRG